MPLTSKAFVRATVFLLGVGILTVIAILVAAVWLAGRNHVAADDLIEVLEIRREALTVLGGIQEAESGQRGYLLTRSDPYLRPYTAAVTHIDAELDRLHALAKNRPSYAGKVQTLDARIRAKLAELDETVNLIKSGRSEEALAVVNSGRGLAAMQAVNEAGTDLIHSADALVAANTAQLRSSANLLVWGLAVGGLVIILVVVGIALLAWRYTRDLVVTHSEIRELNATLEARVRERTEDVVRANEEIQRFAYIVSHDLRSPLVNIMGFTSELETGLAQVRAFVQATEAGGEPGREAEDAQAAVESEMAEALGFIRASTTKMDRLINAILTLSREGQRRLMPERVSMTGLLEAAADSVRHRLAETGTELEIVKPIPDIVTDRLSVEQIFGNLIDNAVKYLDPARPGRIVVSARETPLGVEFDVEDNGRGIEAKDHERVFDLFRRAGVQDRPGEGIGLSHVRALVRRMGGAIFLRSEAGVGTTFTVRLPRVLSSPTESEKI
jgi:signal transduction histidine kinase